MALACTQLPKSMMGGCRTLKRWRSVCFMLAGCIWNVTLKLIMCLGLLRLVRRGGWTCHRHSSPCLALMDRYRVHGHAEVHSDQAWIIERTVCDIVSTHQ
ncbi:uncharacterized protein BDW47DRAFT_98642 [Aspergillus candidus]|uniref:Uncharacterized protein n=1 Tax=Aspergillus candidus TaxID=41067 RepID=A0A2I2FMH9_ASPCN|nr:hypothetical protein BDW47DRAFT_98642 [Aspergillus candidus]PLB41832.1 hypothetical protein BDW47DRAFT_98642 [Aspergillus candidus]